MVLGLGAYLRGHDVEFGEDGLHPSDSQPHARNLIECVRERESERECVCVCVCERERE